MRILLVENKFSELSSFLKTHGFVVEHSSFATFFDILKMGEQHSHVLINIEDVGREEVQLIFSYCRNYSLAPIAFSSTIKDSLSQLLKDNGIARFVTIDDIIKNPLILRHGGVYDDIELLRVLHYDADHANTNLVRSICDEYGIFYTCVESEDEFFDSFNEMYHLALLNIGSSEFDMQSFLSRALYCRNLIKSIVTPFAIDGNVSITDISCGLNRIAKVVLNRDELLAFLIRHFHKRELVCAMQSLKNFAQSYCDDEYLTKDSWQLYHERADKFYTSTISLDDDFFNGMALCGGRIKGSTAKVQLFRWLLLDAKGEATCGQGVYI